MIVSIVNIIFISLANRLFMENIKKGWHGFIDLCLKTTDEKTLQSLFELFLTADERDDLAMRYSIIKELLAEEKTQRQMAQDLNVSIAKITRGSNELKRAKPVILQYIKERGL